MRAILKSKVRNIYLSLIAADLEDSTNTDYIYATKLISKTNQYYIKEGFKLLDLYEVNEDYNKIVGT